MTEFLKPSEAANILGVTVATLRSYEAEGLLSFEVQKTAKGHRRYPKKEIMAMKGTLPVRVAPVNESQEDKKRAPEKPNSTQEKPKPSVNRIWLAIASVDMLIFSAPMLFIISLALLGIASVTALSFVAMLFLVKFTALLTALYIVIPKKDAMMQIPFLALIGIVASLVGLILGWLSVSIFGAYCAVCFILKIVQVLIAPNVKAMRGFV